MFGFFSSSFLFSHLDPVTTKIVFDIIHSRFLHSQKICMKKYFYFKIKILLSSKTSSSFFPYSVSFISFLNSFFPPLLSLIPLSLPSFLFVSSLLVLSILPCPSPPASPNYLLLFCLNSISFGLPPSFLIYILYLKMTKYF